MKLSLTHPLWTHVPAVLALAVCLGMLVAAGPLPSNGPIHFGADGRPDGYGSPAGAFALVIGLCVGFILLSVWMDESWARQEREKRFNYFALLDEIVVSAMAGISVSLLPLLQQSEPVFRMPATEMLAFAVPAVGAAVLLEKMRPFAPREEALVEADTSALRKDIDRRLKSGATISYTDIQNPLYMNLVAVGVPAVLFVSTALTAASQPLWSIALNLVSGLLLASFYGGMRTTVTRDRITVRFGTPGLRVLRLQPSDVVQADLRPYLPLQEFGGYGIRRNSRMSGYFLKGGVGVEIATKQGRRLLIGSDRPERLAEAVRAVAGLAATPSRRG
ncbi:MAG: DUF1648 domain-containing protein [Dehalococcoidia bacterium]|jgi:hypothetical protein|nr:DUF1648 domain-containing protein [Dehalococcoidia bacterium]